MILTIVDNHSRLVFFIVFDARSCYQIDLQKKIRTFAIFIILIFFLFFLYFMTML